MNAVLDAPRQWPVELYDNAEHYEIVDGNIVELPPMGAKAQITASNLQAELNVFAKRHRMGTVGMETLIKLPQLEDRQRRPDIIFVPSDRWPAALGLPEGNAWPILPALVVEVVSRFDLAEELNQKIEECFHAGVDQVWIVFPEQRTAWIFESPSKVSILRSGDSFDGGTLLPGFRLALDELMPPPAGDQRTSLQS